MKPVLNLLIGFLLVAGFIYVILIVGGNPHEREIENLQKEAMQADAEIANAQTISDCKLLSNLHLARNTRDALTQFHENLNGSQSEAFFDEVESIFAVTVESKFYLHACLRHLHDKGIVPLDKSVPSILEDMTDKETESEK